MGKININNLTLGQIREIQSMFPSGDAAPVSVDGCAFEIGEAYFIRTVTNYITGRLVEIHGRDLVMEDAAWVASTGRFAGAIKSGELSEVEPYPDGVQVIVSRGAIVDACLWTHALPRAQK